MFTQVSIVASLVLFASGMVIRAPQTSITLINNCGYQVDPAFYPGASENGSLTGGFPLAAGASQVITLADGYSGRIWGRTGCDASGACTAGTCFTGGENCTSEAPTGPTLAQFTIDGYASYDYIAPTGSGGNFNIPLTITPGSGCSISPLSCTDAAGDGNGCGSTSACPTGTEYSIEFC